MKINVLPLLAACVLTLSCLLTAVLYRAKVKENHRLQVQVSRLQKHNIQLMAEYSELRSHMDKKRSPRVHVSYVIESVAEGAPVK